MEFVTRDRSYGSAKGITEGGPDAVQVADRFHLLVKLWETFDDEVVERNRQRLPGIVLPQTTPCGEAKTDGGTLGSRERQPA